MIELLGTESKTADSFEFLKKYATFHASIFHSCNLMTESQLLMLEKLQKPSNLYNLTDDPWFHISTAHEKRFYTSTVSTASAIRLTVIAELEGSFLAQYYVDADLPPEAFKSPAGSCRLSWA
ncbi:nuclear pore complex protein NUP85-like isoform X1 [Salvia divinorum]|uniref:Nuclear pore complex protein NUP85-like isoform X1 n=1 Tax=Salvia divinorum TaxID=28513 RepID=A0ABD1I4I7_SALDI